MNPIQFFIRLIQCTTHSYALHEAMNSKSSGISVSELDRVAKILTSAPETSRWTLSVRCVITNWRATDLGLQIFASTWRGFPTIVPVLASRTAPNKSGTTTVSIPTSPSIVPDRSSTLLTFSRAVKTFVDSFSSVPSIRRSLRINRILLNWSLDNGERDAGNDAKACNPASRLEKKIEYLETSGLEAALTGTPTKLKSKLKGCKARILDLETTCVTNAAAVRKLRMDTQFMKTQEVTVQREVFAQEVRRLQKCLYRLQNLCKRVCDDKNEAIRLKEGIASLTAKNPTLETSISLHRRSLEKMATESVEREAKQAVAKKACARDYEGFRGLQEESKSLLEALYKEKLTKADLTTSVNTAMHRVREAERETREKKRNAALGLE